MSWYIPVCSQFRFRLDYLLTVCEGNGSTTESVRHCLYTLRRLLSPAYAVIPVTGDVLIKEPWFSTCALLVFQGGADLG